MTWLGRIGRFQWIQELWVIGGKITRSRRLPPYCWKLKRPPENFRLKNEDSGLKSGSRERCLPQSFEALNLWVKIPVQEEFISCKNLKNCQRRPAATMHDSNMGIPPYWPDILLITWGLLLHKAGVSGLLHHVRLHEVALKRPPVYPLSSLFKSIMLYHLGVWSCPNQYHASW